MEFGGAIREAKKGTAELVVLAFLEDEPRHGYELTQLIEERSGGALTFNFASLYATLYKLEERKMYFEALGRKIGPAPAPLLQYYRDRARGAGFAAKRVASVLRIDWRPRRSSICVTANVVKMARWSAHALTPIQFDDKRRNRRER